MHVNQETHSSNQDGMALLLVLAVLAATTILAAHMMLVSETVAKDAKVAAITAELRLQAESAADMGLWMHLTDRRLFSDRTLGVDLSDRDATSDFEPWMMDRREHLLYDETCQVFIGDALKSISVTNIDSVKSGIDVDDTDSLDVANEFIDIYNMLAFDSCYDYDCRDFSKYGFDNPKMRLEVTFRDVEGNDVDYMLEFGGKNADGDYYVRTNYTNHVNIINSTNAYTFLTFDVFDYVYRTLYAGLGENVEKIIIESGGKQKILLPDPQDEDYNNIGALVRVLAIDSVAKDASRAGEEAAKITISWSGKTDVWTFLQYDENSLYLLDINGNDQSFVVTKASLDEILSQAGLQ